MTKNNKEILLQIWLIVKQVFGIIFMILAWIFHLIYELAHLSDENYQRKKRIQAQYDMKREWLQRARAEDILNDWRLKAAGLRPESREEAIILEKLETHRDENVSSLLSPEELETLILWILRALGLL